MARVNDLMRRNFVTVAPSVSAVEVARKMRDHQTGFVMVCDQGKLRGIVTEESIVSTIVARERNPKRENAGSIMQNDLPRITPGADITEAAKVMGRNGVHFLPVVDKGKLVGILTLPDLTRESPALAFMVMTRSFDKLQWEGGKEMRHSSRKDAAYVG